MIVVGEIWTMCLRVRQKFCVRPPWEGRQSISKTWSCAIQIVKASSINPEKFLGGIHKNPEIFLKIIPIDPEIPIKSPISEVSQTAIPINQENVKIFENHTHQSGLYYKKGTLKMAQPRTMEKISYPSGRALEITQGIHS